MEDPKITHSLEYCRKLLKLWQEFHLFISDCTDHARVFTPEDEAAFLDIKSQIAILYDAFFDSLHSPDRETIATAQSIITVVENCILLRQIQKMSPAELKRMEIEWHESYLLINTTIGYLEEEFNQLAQVSPGQHRRQVMKKKVTYYARNFARSRGLHALLALGAIAVVLVVLPMFNVFSYDALNQNKQTAIVYQAARHIIRSTVNKDVAFQDWGDFMARHGLRTPMENTDTVPDDVIEDFRSMFNRIRGDRKTLVARNVSNVKDPGFIIKRYTDSGLYNQITRAHPNGAAAYMIFESTAGAKGAMAEFNAQFGQDPLVKAHRFANVVAIAKAEIPEMVDKLNRDVIQMIGMGKEKKK